MKKAEFIILVVDDDEIARDVVSVLLSREGYTVLRAGDGSEAIETLGRDDIKMVITDLLMPRIGGMEVLQYALRKDADICVVILTAYGTIDTTLEAMQNGAYDYVTKPFKGQEILFLADRAFERYGLLQQNRELKALLRRAVLHEAGRAAGLPPETDEVPSWTEQGDRLEALGVLTADEVNEITERLGIVHGKGNSSYR